MEILNLLGYINKVELINNWCLKLLYIFNLENHFLLINSSVQNVPMGITRSYRLGSILVPTTTYIKLPLPTYLPPPAARCPSLASFPPFYLTVSMEKD